MKFKSLLLDIFLVALGYFILARGSLYFATLNNVSSPIWLPTGLAFFAMLIKDKKVAYGILFGAFLTNKTIGVPWLSSIMIGVGSTLEAITFLMIYKLINPKDDLSSNHQRNLALALAIAMGAMVSALIGNISLLTFNVIQKEMFWRSTLTWWTGGALGALILTPLLINFYLYFKSSKKAGEDLKSNFIRFYITFVIALIVNYFLYKNNHGYYFIFILFYLSLMAFLLLPTYLAYLITSMIYAISIYATLRQLGPFQNGNTNDGLLHTQLFYIGFAFTIINLEVFAKNKKHHWPFVVLFFGWFLAGALYIGFVSSEETREAATYKSMISDIKAEIEKNLSLYESFLNAGKGFILSQEEDPDHIKWRVFSEEFKLKDKYRGINGIGFIEKVPFLKLKAFEKSHQKIYGNEFAIHDVPGFISTKNQDHFIITSIEPIFRNKPALGLAVSSEPIRKKAALKSLETKMPVVTDVIQLVQDNTKGPGFLYFSPVYDKKGHFLLWVYAPFVGSKIFGTENEKYNNKIEYAVSSSTDSEHKLLRGTQEAYQNSDTFENIKFADTEFKISFKKGPEFDRSTNLVAAWTSTAAAILILLTAIIVSNFQSLSDEANRIAEEKTNALKNNESLLLNTAKLTALGEMAGGVAHEINNPLMIIAGKVESIEHHYLNSRENKDLILSEIGKIRATVTRISNIIKGLRLFSRSAENDPFEKINIIGVIEDTISLCNERFRTHGVKLEYRSEFNEIQVSCRGPQISQVILNLLNNSFDAVQNLNSSWVKIEVKLVDNNFVEISVTDSGHGIPPEIASKIFQPFYTTKEVGKGTGLGLSISSGIIADHSGKLSIDSNSTNTRFVIRLPIAT